MPDADSGSQVKEAHNPVARISKPDFVDWHMILDNELSQLSRPETGVLGSIGFMTLGAALGLIPPFVEACKKISESHSLSTFDFTSACAFVLSLTSAVVCLAIFAMVKWRNAGLADRIRKRPKYSAD